MSNPEIDTFISRLDADPFLRVSALSEETEPWQEGEGWDCRNCSCKDMVHSEQPCGCARCIMMRVQEIRKNKTSYYHKKVSRDSVLCGKSIFGLLTSPTTYYHATYRAYLDSILQYGLGGVEHKNWDCSTGDVCLSPDPYDAESYAECAPDEGLVPPEVEASGIVVLSVQIEGLIGLRYDPNIDEGDNTNCLVYSGVISPERIGVCD